MARKQLLYRETETANGAGQFSGFEISVPAGAVVRAALLHHLAVDKVVFGAMVSAAILTSTTVVEPAELGIPDSVSEVVVVRKGQTTSGGSGGLSPLGALPTHRAYNPPLEIPAGNVLVIIDVTANDDLGIELYLEELR